MKKDFDPLGVSDYIIIGLGEYEYQLRDVYEQTLQVLRPRLKQLIATLCSYNTLPSSSLKGSKPTVLKRAIQDLIITPEGNWYSKNDLSSGNIITLIQYMTGMDVFDAVEWSWDTFIVNTSADIHTSGRCFR